MVRDAHVHTHHAAIGALGELPGVVTVLREDHRAVGEGVLIHELQAFLKTLHALDAQHRAKTSLCPTVISGVMWSRIV